METTLESVEADLELGNGIPLSSAFRSSTPDDMQRVRIREMRDSEW